MQPTPYKEFLCALLQNAVQHAPTTLSYYIDCQEVTMSPLGMSGVANVIAEVLHPDITAIGGLPIGADPIAAAVVYHCNSTSNPYRLGMFSVRDKQKDYGNKRRLSGPHPGVGAKVALVDDVLTTGGSLLAARRAVEESGLVVAQIVVLVDRPEFGGKKILQSRGYCVDSIFTLRSGIVQPT